MDLAADVGGMTADFQLDIVHRQVIDAQAKGARILTGGATLLDNELFYRPTLITGIEDDMALMTQETFGPVVPILPFNTEDEVVDCCNASAFGLSASVWSKIWRVPTG